MGTNRVVRSGLWAVVAMTIVVVGACTSDSDDEAAPTTTSSTTTIPDEQKPPELRDSWMPEDLEQLADIDVPDYESEETDLTDTALTRVFVSDPDPEGITLTAEVRLAPCDPEACWDLAQPPNEERLTSLQSLLPPVHRDNPNLLLVYGPDELIGDFEAFTFQWRSFVPDENAYATGYHTLYHDGLNRIEVTVTPNGAPEPTDDRALEDQMPDDWAREVTADVFAAFADEFNADA